MKFIIISFVIISKKYFFKIFIIIIGYNSLTFVNYIPLIKSKLVIQYIIIKLGSIIFNNAE